MHELEIMFVGDLERILTPRGWIRREAGRFALASFTKDIGGGVLAVADIVRARISMSARGEDVFEVRRGWDSNRP